MKKFKDFLNEAQTKTITVDWAGEIDIRNTRDGQKDLNNMLKDAGIRAPSLKVVKVGTSPNGDDELSIRGSVSDLEKFVDVYGGGDMTVDDLLEAAVSAPIYDVTIGRKSVEPDEMGDLTVYYTLYVNGKPVPKGEVVAEMDVEEVYIKVGNVEDMIGRGAKFVGKGMSGIDRSDTMSFADRKLEKLVREYISSNKLSPKLKIALDKGIVIPTGRI